jgi:hypothetical protein
MKRKAVNEVPLKSGLQNARVPAKPKITPTHPPHLFPLHTLAAFIGARGSGKQMPQFSSHMNTSKREVSIVYLLFLLHMTAMLRFMCCQLKRKIFIVMHQTLSRPYAISCTK